MTFLLLTGIPRSGTTLAAALIDRMEDAICLSEPDEHVELMRSSADASNFAETLHQALLEAKRRLAAGEPVADRRAPDGSVVTNYFAEPGVDGRRAETFHVGSHRRGLLSAGALIAAKHNALFSAVLPELIASGHFRIVAIVRDPVAVIRSWRSLSVPVSGGRLPAADRYWPEMRALTASDIPLLDKQVAIYELLCRRFADHRARIVLLRYEEIVADPAILAHAAGRNLDAAALLALRSMVSPRASSGAADGEIADAVTAACRDGRADALAKLYPAYR